MPIKEGSLELNDRVVQENFYIMYSFIHSILLEINTD